MHFCLLAADANASAKLTARIVIAVLICAAFALLFYLCVRLRRTMIRRLTYSRSFSSDGVYAGGTLRMTEEVVNRSFLPLLFVDIGFFIPSGLIADGREIDRAEQFCYFRSRFHIPPHSRLVRTHKITARDRGHYSLSTAEIQLTREEKFYFDAPAELYVYPAMLPRLPRPQNNFNSVGDTITNNRFITDPFLRSGLRDYRYGDPLNTVNFRASARSLRGGRRRLLVNNCDSSTNCNVMLIINFATDSEVISDYAALLRYIEYSLSYAATFLWDASRNGGRTGFAANASADAEALPYTFHRCSGGRIQLIEIMKSLSTIHNYTGFSFNALIDRTLEDIPEDTETVIVSSRRADVSPSRLAALRRRSRNVTTVLLDELQSQL